MIGTGEHILNLTMRNGVGFKSGFDAVCNCGEWRYEPVRMTLDEARRFHAAHLDAVVAEQTEANDA